MLRISTQTFLGSHHLSHCVDRPRRRRNVLRIPPNTTQAVGRYSYALSQVDVSVVIRRHHVDRPKMTPIVYATHQVDEIQCQLSSVVNKIDQEPDAEDEANNIGVKAALSMLKFYKREISPLLPKSCRYVPSCSEYSMIAYKKYGFVKGTVLTTWRLCRCNPLGGSGFDPPRWFDEERVAEE